MSKLFLSADFTNRDKKNSNAIFQFSHINHILMNHSDFKSLRRPLNVVFNDKLLTQIEHDLKRCSRTKILHVMFYLKNFIEILLMKTLK